MYPSLFFLLIILFKFLVCTEKSNLHTLIHQLVRPGHLIIVALPFPAFYLYFESLIMKICDDYEALNSLNCSSKAVIDKIL